MGVAGVVGGGVVAGSADFVDMLAVDWQQEERDVDQEGEEEIGRASCRERVCT